MADKSLAELLAQSAQKVFAKTNQIEVKENPEIREREIIEYHSRMRVSGMERFNDASYISVVELYASDADMESKHVSGAVVIYVREDMADRFYRALGYRDFDETLEESMIDVCSEVANSVAKQFITDLQGKGLGSFISAAPLKYKNTIGEGVRFSYDERTYFEIDFKLFDEHSFSIDLTLATT